MKEINIDVIKEKFDFFESIIEEIIIKNSFHLELKIFYFWDDITLSDSKIVVLGFENCSSIKFNMNKALNACKKDLIVNPNIEIDDFYIERLNNKIHIIIKTQFNENMIEILCESIYVEY